MLLTPKPHAHQTSCAIPELQGYPPLWNSCLEGGSKFASPSLSKSLGRGFNIFSWIEVKHWVQCWESFKCRKAQQWLQLRTQTTAALGLSGGCTLAPGGGRTLPAPAQHGLLSTSVPTKAERCVDAGFVGGRESLQPSSGVLVFWEAVLQKSFYAQLFWADCLQNGLTRYL